MKSATKRRSFTSGQASNEGAVLSVIRGILFKPVDVV